MAYEAETEAIAPTKRKSKMDLVDLQLQTNIAEKLDDETLGEILEECMEGYDQDKSSCSDRNSQLEQAMQIAKQIKQEKSTPWPGASNVLYPLIANASISFAARTYPEIIRNGKVVECAVLGKDPDGMKADRAQRISQHMSAQLLVEDPEWEGDTDRLLSVLAVMGTVFKKTFFDEYWKRNRSIMCDPDEIIVSNDIKSLETAERISHRMYMCPNDVIARCRLGIFCDVEDDLMEDYGDSECCDDNDILIEQHCYLDLDEDGYKEPYIVTIHKGLNKVLRIYHRWDPQDVYMNDKQQVWRIDPTHYFTDFHFMNSPDGKYYSVGFGQLLLPINESINTTINQLLDAGTCSNMQSGLLGKGFKTKSGSLWLTPGEFKKVDVLGDDLAKNIFPMPVREPSNVLFQLLGILIQTGKELASVSEVLQGQEHAQNSSPTTVLALIEQGMKVFSAIQKRVYRALKKEFGKLYRLNRLHLNDQIDYKQVLNSLIISKDDYTDRDMDVIPVSDPSMSSDAQRMARAQAMMQIMPQVGPAGQQAILRNWLESLQTPESQIALILPPPDPHAPPSPEQVKAMMEQQQMQQGMAESQIKADIEGHKLELQKLQTQINQMSIEQQNRESQARIDHMLRADMLAEQTLMATTQNAQLELSIKAQGEIDKFVKEQDAQK